MNYSIDIDHNLKIIKYKHSGIIKHEDIGKAWEEFLQMKEFTELQYGLFSDYRGGKFNIKLAFLPALIEFMHSIKSVVEKKKQCLIVDDPFSTAAAILFENRVNKEIGFQVKVFNTETAALKWLTA